MKWSLSICNCAPLQSGTRAVVRGAHREAAWRRSCVTVEVHARHARKHVTGEKLKITGSAAQRQGTRNISKPLAALPSCRCCSTTACGNVALRFAIRLEGAHGMDEWMEAARVDERCRQAHSE